MTDRCDGRYPVPHKREEPFPVTYRCALFMGHDGPHGDGNNRPEPIEQPSNDRSEPMAPGAPDIPALIVRLRAAADAYDNYAKHDFERALLRETADALTALSASHEALKEERDKLRRMRELDQRTINRYLPCPDCRDKVRADECQRCARQAAEAQVAALTAALVSAAGWVRRLGGTFTAGDEESMRTTLTDGRMVRIQFHHEQFPAEVRHLRQRRPDREAEEVWVKAETLCALQVLTPEPTPAPVVIAQGIARCAVADPFCKETARQISLRRAVEGLSRVDRGRVLAAYFNRRRALTPPQPMW